MLVARLFCPGLSRENSYQSGLALHQALQAGLHLGQVFEMMHALGASAKFARSLRTSQQQHAKNGGFATREIEDLLQAMFVFGDPAIGAAGRASEPFSLEGIQRLPDRVFVQIHHRIAIIFLVARIDQRVQ